jgi:hypothetical protein
MVHKGFVILKLETLTQNQAEQWWCTEAAHRRVFARESVYWAASVTTGRSSDGNPTP